MLNLIARSFFFTALVATAAHAAEAPVPTIIDPTIFTVREQLGSAGFYQWAASGYDCLQCQTLVIGTTLELQTPQVQEFLRSLGEHKAEILELYRGNKNEAEMASFADEYNSLARMAVGILGRESKFFTSARYQIKEQFPEAVHVLKSIELLALGQTGTPSPNSRGPTQIKTIPPKVAARYGITPDNLSKPENAAIATVAFLIESLNELHRLVTVHHLTEINAENEMDYVPYIYFGSMKALITHQARPDKNAYVADLRVYMNRVEIFEKPSTM